MKKVTYPTPPSGIVFRLALSKSAVLVYTVFPHHRSTEFLPIALFLGYSRQKNTMSMPNANPESKAADRTSGENHISGKDPLEIG